MLEFFMKLMVIYYNFGLKLITDPTFTLTIIFGFISGILIGIIIIDFFEGNGFFKAHRILELYNLAKSTNYIKNINLLLNISTKNVENKNNYKYFFGFITDIKNKESYTLEYYVNDRLIINSRKYELMNIDLKSNKTKINYSLFTYNKIKKMINYFDKLLYNFDTDNISIKFKCDKNIVFFGNWFENENHGYKLDLYEPIIVYGKFKSSELNKEK